MEADITTYNDLHIFQHGEEYSIFNKLNFTKTAEGRHWLHNFYKYPFSDPKLINETQNILKLIIEKTNKWPSSISNGTLMVISKFYESGIDNIPGSNDYVNALSYKIFHAPDYSLLKYSLTHFADFLRGMKQLIALFSDENTPPAMNRYLLRAKDLISGTVALELANHEAGKAFSVPDTGTRQMNSWPYSEEWMPGILWPPQSGILNYVFRK
jgi:DNA mismatch repair protein MutS